MAERSKELLQLEHKGRSLSSLVAFVCAESTLLVCDNKRESNTQTKGQPPAGTPLTSSVPPSQFLGKVKDFLGVMSEANKQLELDVKDHPEKYDIEELTRNESKVIEMDLMIGVADLHTPDAVAAAESAISNCPPVLPLAANESGSDSDENSADDDNGDDEIESTGNECDDGNNSDKPVSLVQKSMSGKDNINEKQKGNRCSQKRPKIVELS
ncbi:hypothetical protein E2542_SST28997 [Spatholobus suberectus]|nr:hypothetical protein E2542_SST28997 [Spatholobus suberectus]